MRLFYNIPLLLLISNCHSSDVMQTPEYYYLNYNDVAYPYIEYIQSERKNLFKEVKGYFIHPIFERKDRVLQLDYDETSRSSVRSLFGEELFGDGGKVFLENNIWRSDFFYMSIPQDSSTKIWEIIEIRSKYDTKKNIKYKCEKIKSNGDRFSAECSRNPFVKNKIDVITLKFEYNKKNGITYYEDICGNEICGYKLTNKNGLFSESFHQIINVK